MMTASLFNNDIYNDNDLVVADCRLYVADGHSMTIASNSSNVF